MSSRNQMFPVSDFNFVVCGIATFAATVGYAYTRRPVPSSSDRTPDVQSQSAQSSNVTGAELKTTTAESATPQSLVKPEDTAQNKDLSTQPQPMESVDDVSSSPVVAALSPLPLDLLQHTATIDTTSTEHSGSTTPPVSVVSIPQVPAKRPWLKRKSLHEETEGTNSDLHYPNNLNAIYPNKRSRTPSFEEKNLEAEPTQIVAAPVEVAPILSVPTPAELDAQREAKIIESLKQTARQIVKPLVFQAPNKSPLISPPMTPPQSRTTTINTPRGFAAFAGSASPFVSAKSSFSAPQAGMGKSIWSVHQVPATAFSVAGPSSEKPNALASSSSVNDNNKEELEEGEVSIKAIPSPHAIGAVEASKPTFTHVTGEEDEDVEQELKGVKLFVNRGNKGFSGAMLGNVKLLSNKSTSAERLVFRRDPLWQVSMNVWMNPGVRCTYDQEENALRIALQEPLVAPGSSRPNESRSEIVVYALKPSRACSKADFKEFADALVSARSTQSTTIPEQNKPTAASTETTVAKS